MEHGLIRVAAIQHETVPKGAQLFVNVDGIMRPVKRTRFYKRTGFLLTVLTPEGNKQVPVRPDDFLVISYANLDNERTAVVFAHSRHASLPLRAFEHRNNVIAEDGCAGIVG